MPANLREDDVIKMKKSRLWEEEKTKVPGLQIYVKCVKVIVNPNSRKANPGCI